METAGRKKLTTKELVYISMFAAIMAVCSWISVPAPAPLSPFTMQTFGVFAALLILGGRKGLLSVLVFILLGTVGAPVFSGFKGGLGVILGTTGGYIVGFIFMALVYIAAEKLFGSGSFVKLMALIVGLAVCYAFGTAWFMVVYTKNTGSVGLGTALMWCVVPFILPDIAKLLLAWSLSAAVGKRLSIR